ncbi:hypothetical protein PanWU01x14_003290 [Parasponia andersonii]|uniref:Transmembrane protein n=1 Tax=Parasponia andersonii TaxID=3476 RepID=A0A2P5E5F7_PARAD|nr:hypothetical protein PanWU01x14_003290 [Parasponia andersonii]
MSVLFSRDNRLNTVFLVLELLVLFLPPPKVTGPRLKRKTLLGDAVYVSSFLVVECHRSPRLELL